MDLVLDDAEEVRVLHVNGGHVLGQLAGQVVEVQAPVLRAVGRRADLELPLEAGRGRSSWRSPLAVRGPGARGISTVVRPVIRAAIRSAWPAAQPQL